MFLLDFMRIRNSGILFFAALAALSGASARADTATFVQPVANPLDIVGAPDLDGVLVPRNMTLDLFFDGTYASSPLDAITIFATNGGRGGSVGRLSFGRWNGGAPTIFHSQNLAAAGPTSVGLNFLYYSGCGDAGCDFLRISTVSSWVGSPGFAVDAISLNGSFLDGAQNIVGAAPEPKAWALMIFSFLGVAWRMKAIRAQGAGLRAAPAPIRLLDVKGAAAP